jgi:hypothetical protein
MMTSMNHGRTMRRAIPLLIGAGLALSACAADSGYYTSSYGYNVPIYGDWNGWHDDGPHGWRRGAHPHVGWIGGGRANDGRAGRR